LQEGLKVVPGWFDKSLLMAGTGRKRIATRAECAEVRRMAGEGASVIKVALVVHLAVFGSGVTGSTCRKYIHQIMSNSSVHDRVGSVV
jgi:hypothetical protein